MGAAKSPMGIGQGEFPDNQNDTPHAAHELPSVNRRRGGSNLANTLGFAVLLLGGLGMMYYVNSGDDDDAAEKKKQKAEQVKISNTLPPLDIPKPPEPMPLANAGVPEIQPGQLPPGDPIALQKVNTAAAPPSGPQAPIHTWMDRKMEGSVVISKGSSGKSGSESASDENGNRLVNTNVANKDASSPLALKLKPSVFPGASASMLPDRNYLITKGTALDCALETAIDSTVPGLTTCRLTRDVYSDNGHVVLLDRGSQLVGEYQGGITAGQARIFVLWTRAKTPNGVVVALDSPGTDTLGRSGHNGWVDTHFFERFGAAIMMSLVKDSVKYAIAKQQQSGSTVVIGGNGDTDQLATEILKNTVNIPPTLYVNQGDHIQIMVARDLDFSTVYGLEPKEDLANVSAAAE